MEHRDSPRFRVYLPVELDGIELTANNISSSGMQVSCPDFLYGRLEQTLDQDTFEVNIQLPVIEQPCIASCKTIYHSEFGDELLLGLQYHKLEDTHQNALTGYLQELSNKNTPVVEE
jgi:c-di-GMP-binding flagellar brake protein YcgR